MYKRLVYCIVIASSIYASPLESGNSAKAAAYKPLLLAGALVAPRPFKQNDTHDTKTSYWIMARDGAFWASVVSATAAYGTALFGASSCKVPVRWIGISICASIASCVAHRKVEQIKQQDVCTSEISNR